MLTITFVVFLLSFYTANAQIDPPRNETAQLVSSFTLTKENNTFNNSMDPNEFLITPYIPSMLIYTVEFTKVNFTNENNTHVHLTIKDDKNNSLLASTLSLYNETTNKTYSVAPYPGNALDGLSTNNRSWSIVEVEKELFGDDSKIEGKIYRLYQNASLLKDAQWIVPYDVDKYYYVANLTGFDTLYTYVQINIRIQSKAAASTVGDAFSSLNIYSSSEDHLEGYNISQTLNSFDNTYTPIVGESSIYYFVLSTRNPGVRLPERTYSIWVSLVPLKEDTTALWIGVGVVGGIFAILLVVAILYLFCRKNDGYESIR